MTGKISGGCRCGAVRYESVAEPALTVQCCCSDCQKFYAGGLASAVVLPREALEITGEVSHYEVPGSSGEPVDRGFCPTCGTPLFGWPGIAPHLVSVTVGSLDDPNWFRPQICVFTANAPPWAVLPKDVPHFPGMPEMTDIAELMGAES